MVATLVLDGGVPKGALAGPTPRARLPCRGIGVEGRVTFGTADLDAGRGTLGIGSEVPGDVWIDMAESSKLTTKDPRSGRELSFEGPAHVAPCRPPEDEAWLTTGSMASIPGTGEGPGSEEWVVTALGVVRYGASVLRVTAADPEHAEVHVAAGSAWLWVAEGTVERGDAGLPHAGGGWRRLDAGATLSLTARRSEKISREDDARDAANRCASAAKAARDLAGRIAAPDAALSDLAPRHVAARQGARATCAVARLRADALPAGGGRRALLSSLFGSDETWRGAAPNVEP